MKRYAGLLGLAVVLLAGSTAGAQEAITIKLRENAEGDSTVIKKSEKTTTKVKIADGNGNVLLDQSEVKGEAQDFTETVLKREAGKSPSKLERAYSKAQTTKEADTRDVDLKGKTVVIEKQGGKYSFKYKGGEGLMGDAAELLEKNFAGKSDKDSEIEKLVLPKMPVKVGETWKVDMAKIVAELAGRGDMNLDVTKSTGEGKLLKAYKKDGRQFGELKIHMEAPIVKIGKDNGQLNFMPGAKIVLDLSLDVCIDGSADLGTMKMSMTMTGNASLAAAAGATATLDVSADAHETHGEVSKK